MSTIPESYYVNVAINYNSISTLTGAVPMSVLISKTAISTKDYTALQQVLSDYDDTDAEYKAAKIYFDNGGTNLLIYAQTSGVTDTQVIAALLAAYSDFIWVTFLEDKTDAELKTIIGLLEAAGQQLPKFLAQTTKIADETTTLADAGYSQAALLYSDEATVTPYSAIAIAAYFSGIDTAEANSIKSIVHTQISDVVASDLTTAELTTLYADNWNVIVNLGGRYTTLDGGKMIDGEPIHSAWGFAVFKKDAEDSVTDLLVDKLPYDNSSNAVLENALSSICNDYVANGLIGTNKTYTADTQYKTYNGVQYTVIKKGQVLNNGYYIYSIPVSNATTADKALSKIPPIYIYAIIGDIIRMVTITGEVSK